MTGQWPDYEAEVLDPKERAKGVFEAQVTDVGTGRKADRDAQIALAKAKADAEIALGKAEADKFVAWETANRAADVANLDKFHTAMYTVAGGAIERSRSAAELVQKASAAIAALYTGVLALVFSVTNNPLPARGVLAPLFLGLAVVLSTAYVAYLGPADGSSPGPAPALGLEPKSFQRLNAFIHAANTIVVRRSTSLRASVIALGFGLIFIALPFVSFTSSTKDPAALPAKPAFPTPAPGATSELDKLLYQAQLDEVKQARARASAGTGQSNQGAEDIPVLVVGLIVGALGVWLLPSAIKGTDDGIDPVPQDPGALQAQGVGGVQP
jgi:hypothetical protein